jgi:hypothetical protein
MNMKRIFQMLFFAIFMSAALASAQPKDNEGFVPVDGSMMNESETVPARRLVGIAYGFILAAVVAWVASVTRRSRRVEDELEALKKKLETRV